ncbi:hypothetical protein AVEN_121924-1 [Araneus ventricosus]|uniref:Uncharacterized protein n=1 Tax=Araneus ventricosus TaxID=182803 RepID=A0A4Y2PAQ4_ARAVE|nr:hypothetical protein AVEN_121924-1 [Araneus ventricosus]
MGWSGVGCVAPPTSSSPASCLKPEDGLVRGGLCCTTTSFPPSCLKAQRDGLAGGLCCTSTSSYPDQPILLGLRHEGEEEVVWCNTTHPDHQPILLG